MFLCNLSLPAQVGSAELQFPPTEEGLSCLTPGLPPRAPHPTLDGADQLSWGPSTEPDAKEVLTTAPPPPPNPHTCTCSQCCWALTTGLGLEKV